MECTFTADRGDAGQRIDHVLRRHFGAEPGVSRTRIQSWVEAGLVHVGGKPIGKPSARVPAGSVIDVRVSGALRERRVPAAEPGAVEILFEDEHLLAVNKAPGVVSHPSFRNPSGTLLNALLWLARTWPPGTRPSLVSRLDKQTSGVLLVARTRAVHAAVQRAMQQGLVEKTYLAVVHGRPAPASGRIELSLGRGGLDRRRVVATATGRASLTEYTRVVTAGRGAAALSVVRCRLVTGRMHQIRVHLAARGWPIVGDAAYGRARARGDAEVHPPIERQALHAWRVAFRHPVTGAPVEIEAPLPRDVRALVDWVRRTAPRRH